jgi:Protein of unknown function (DUF2892)
MAIDITIPTTAGRVPEHTSEEVNRRIRHATEIRLAEVVAEGQAAINERLCELEQEWDVERILEANAASAVLAGLALGATVDRRFFALPALVAAFLLQHAVQGWCPPLPILRRLGARTQREIDQERTALKILRGDFDALVVHPSHRPHEASSAALEAAERD